MSDAPRAPPRNARGRHREPVGSGRASAGPCRGRAHPVRVAPPAREPTVENATKLRTEDRAATRCARPRTESTHPWTRSAIRGVAAREVTAALPAWRAADRCRDQRSQRPPHAALGERARRGGVGSRATHVLALVSPPGGAPVRPAGRHRSPIRSARAVARVLATLDEPVEHSRAHRDGLGEGRRAGWLGNASKIATGLGLRHARSTLVRSDGRSANAPRCGSPPPQPGCRSA